MTMAPNGHTTYSAGCLFSPSVPNENERSLQQYIVARLGGRSTGQILAIRTNAYAVCAVAMHQTEERLTVGRTPRSCLAWPQYDAYYVR